MKKINKTQTISELLNSFTFGDENSKGKSFSDTIKQSTLFSFWDDIIGSKLAKYTKPSKIKYSKLYVSVKSSTIVQELEFIKQKIVKKTNTYALALGFEIKDIIFDYKKYIQEQDTENKPEEKLNYYNNEQISEIKIDEEYKKQISNNIAKINFLSDEQKEKLVEQILNVKKAKIKRQDN